ncbi:hypothetical protein AB6N23_03870 [Cellulomonas sp. 179-A 9B4 NHS]|uniref:hypothetical protein n=1 Tax=Cellulomonas sp. 179-A 9B4 NHS TaxID=3142379 RepID=UPI0039A1FD2D
MAAPFDIDAPLGTPRLGCVAEERGHVPASSRVRVAVSAAGETYRVTGVERDVAADGPDPSDSADRPDRTDSTDSTATTAGTRSTEDTGDSAGTGTTGSPTPPSLTGRPGVVLATRHDGAPARWWVHDIAPFEEHARSADPTVRLHDGGVVRVGSRYRSVATDGAATPCVEGVVRPTGTRYAVLERALPLDPTLVAVRPHTASLYRLDPPMRTRGGPVAHVVVVAQHGEGGGWTQIFGADPDAQMRPGDLPGSYEGGTDHVEALQRAGYEVVLPPL